jgi:hypothetical protein
MITVRPSAWNGAPKFIPLFKYDRLEGVSTTRFSAFGMYELGQIGA